MKGVAGASSNVTSAPFKCDNSTARYGVRCCADRTPSYTPPQPVDERSTLSKRGCTELYSDPRYDWRQVLNSPTNICGTSYLKRGTCFPRNVTFTAASKYCKQAGGRLCSVSEIRNGNVDLTGCDVDNTSIWTLEESACYSVEAGTIGGSKGAEAFLPFRCLARSSLANVRCCADDQPYTPPPPQDEASSPSARGCTEMFNDPRLAWMELAGTTSVCGTSYQAPGECFPRSVTYKSAIKLCKSVGGRLCSVSEIRGREVDGTGCFLDEGRIWTLERSACYREQAGTFSGSSYQEGVYPFECRLMSSTADVRCCADDQPYVPPSPMENPRKLSRRGCSELYADPKFDWSNLFGSPAVCGTSYLRTGQCFSTGTWSQAASFCSSAGGRLCSVSEVLADEVASTGCGGDEKRIWTLEKLACYKGQAGSIAGAASGLALNPFQCRNQSELLCVRCCADEQP